MTYFHAYIDGVDFVFIESPQFRHMGDNIYGGNRTVYIFLSNDDCSSHWFSICAESCAIYHFFASEPLIKRMHFTVNNNIYSNQYVKFFL